ncbi:hypothetical protein GCM10027446_26920 [Angustibacter peucedani]
MSTRTTTVREATSETAARFEARARAARWRSRRPVLVALLLVLALVLLAVLAWAGPLLAVRSVEVQGVTGAQAQHVATVGEAERGTPLPQVDAAAVRSHLAELPYVASVRVERAWPSTLRLVVTPRVAVAAVPRSGGGYRLVDATGTAFQSTSKAPRGVPVVRVPLAGSTAADSLAAALATLEALPGDLRGTVSQVRADTPDDVRMKLGSAQVVWGSADDTELKARVLADLLRHKARTYDVSSPLTPVVR